MEGLNSIPGIDINQKHIYKNTSGIPGEIEKYEKEFGKPYVIGEFGYEWDWSKNFDEFADGMDFDFKRGLWYGLFTSTPVSPMSWWWEYFEDRNLIPYFRGVREINDLMLKSGNSDFKKLNVYAEGLETYGVQCGEMVFVYVLNQSDETVTSSIHIEMTTPEKLNLKSFQPSSLKSVTQRIVGQSNGVVVIGSGKIDAKEDLVFILSGK